MILPSTSYHAGYFEYGVWAFFFRASIYTCRMNWAEETDAGSFPVSMYSSDRRDVQSLSFADEAEMYLG